MHLILLSTCITSSESTQQSFPFSSTIIDIADTNNNNTTVLTFNNVHVAYILLLVSFVCGVGVGVLCCFRARYSETQNPQRSLGISANEESAMPPANVIVHSSSDFDVTSVYSSKSPSGKSYRLRQEAIEDNSHFELDTMNEEEEEEYVEYGGEEHSDAASQWEEENGAAAAAASAPVVVKTKTLQVGTGAVSRYISASIPSGVIDAHALPPSHIVDPVFNSLMKTEQSLPGSVFLDHMMNDVDGRELWMDDDAGSLKDIIVEYVIGTNDDEDFLY